MSLTPSLNTRLIPATNDTHPTDSSPSQKRLECFCPLGIASLYLPPPFTDALTASAQLPLASQVRNLLRPAAARHRVPVGLLVANDRVFWPLGCQCKHKPTQRHSPSSQPSIDRSPKNLFCWPHVWHRSKS